MAADTAWRPADLAEAAWLAETDGDGGWTGYDPGGRPDAVWILHAMYESEAGPTTTTHDDVHRGMLDAGLTERLVIGDLDLDAASVTTGGGLGRSQHPGPGWRRLRWATLADRIGEPVVPAGLRPCFRCLPGAHPSGSWPASIMPPGEGSLDREGWYRLVEVLTGGSPERAATRCLAYFSPAQSGGEPETGRLLAGRLGDAAALYDHPDGDGSPANFWPVDRSWVTWSDWDLWGTKITGPTELVDAVLADGDLEALRLPWC